MLTDPIWSQRCSPVPFAGPRCVRQPGQRLEVPPGVDLLVVTHNNYDHMDLPTLRRVQARRMAATTRRTRTPCSRRALHHGS